MADSKFPVIMVSPDKRECSVHSAVEMNNLVARGYSVKIVEAPPVPIVPVKADKPAVVADQRGK